MAESAKQKKARLAKKAAAQQAAAVYRQVQSSYGLTDAILGMDKTDPTSGFTLKEAFDQIRTEKITDPRRAADILARTNWFQKYGVQVTQNLAQERTAKGVFRAEVNRKKAEIKDYATSLGRQLSEADLSAIARDAYIYGDAYNQSYVVDKIVAKSTATAGGVTGNTLADLQKYSKDMGIQMSGAQPGEDWYSTAANKVAAGDSTVDDFKAQIRDYAKSQYQPFASQIDSGFTVRQLASPYINSMANLLEVGADTIGLDDPTIKQALTGLGKDNQPQLKSMWQFENDLRKDPRWATTKNARDTTDAATHSILKSFGLVS